MKKRVLMVTLSMALVVGVAGIVNAATMGSNATDTPPQATNASAYVNHTLPAQTTQAQPSQTDQTSPSKTNINTPMKSFDVSMDNKVQNMPANTHIQTMPMSTPMNGQMSNSQHQQAMSGTHKSNHANASSTPQQSGQKSSGNIMMESTGRMGR